MDTLYSMEEVEQLNVCFDRLAGSALFASSQRAPLHDEATAQPLDSVSGLHRGMHLILLGVSDSLRNHLLVDQGHSVLLIGERSTQSVYAQLFKYSDSVVAAELSSGVDDLDTFGAVGSNRLRGDIQCKGKARTTSNITTTVVNG